MPSDDEQTNSQKRASNIALFYLSRRARTEKEIHDKLFRKEFEEQDIQKVIKQLLEWRFINDEEYAKNFIRQSKLGKPKGKRRLQFELSRKGINKELIAKMLGEEFGDSGEDLAREALKTYAKKLANLPKEKIYVRAISYLMRRGFSYDEAKKAYEQELKGKSLES